MQDQIEITDPAAYIDRMFADAPAALTRREIQNRTCGAYSIKTLINSDHLGRGIPGRFRIGNKVLYPKDQAVTWLKARTGTVEESSSRGVC